MFPTIERKVRGKFRRSRDFLKPRSDTEEVWHARAGHLGPEALHALVKNARNVIINGIARVKCEHCATTHARQVISRRASERKSPRPFFRISWDLFDFPEGYNGAQWLLMIKDEYSGKLFGYILMSKSLVEVFNTIRDYDHWVKRQYGLAICKIKHDNDRSVIAINGETAYELWVKEEGIELELSPTQTHEPNGGAERAGQEAITKSIKMRIGAGLPENLWPETTIAAVFLYNKSPSYAHDLRAPDEVLDAWFRNYFRWYDPALVTRITTDLRPDWNGIYVYGARAYPMIKEREAGKEKRAFKVKPRGHIGYLVGYCASNIYRIWVPALGRVIITRNVTFDEDILYSREFEQVEGQPIAITKQVIELIEEDEIQDAGSILENVGLWDDDQPGRIEESPILGGGAELLSVGPSGQDSGVEGATPLVGSGLLTPEYTPEPESMPGPQRSRGSERAELLRRFSTLGEEAVMELPDLVGEVHLTERNEERTSPTDRA